MIGPFYAPHSICLNISFWQGSFVGKCCGFNLSANENTVLQFFLKKFLFLVKVLKTLKISSDCHIKHASLLKGGLFQKSLVLFFEKNLCSFC